MWLKGAVNILPRTPGNGRGEAENGPGVDLGKKSDVLEARLLEKSQFEEGAEKCGKMNGGKQLAT